MKLKEHVLDAGPVLVVPLYFVERFGIKPTLLLTQFIYWQHNPHAWFTKSAEEIRRATGLTYREQRSVRALLCREGVTEEFYERKKHQFYYRVKIANLNDIMQTGKMPDKEASILPKDSYHLTKSEDASSKKEDATLDFPSSHIKGLQKGGERAGTPTPPLASGGAASQPGAAPQTPYHVTDQKPVLTGDQIKNQTVPDNSRPDNSPGAKAKLHSSDKQAVAQLLEDITRDYYKLFAIKPTWKQSGQELAYTFFENSAIRFERVRHVLIMAWQAVLTNTEGHKLYFCQRACNVNVIFAEHPTQGITMIQGAAMELCEPLSHFESEKSRRQAEEILGGS